MSKHIYRHLVDVFGIHIYVKTPFFHRSVMGKNGPRRIILSVLLVSRFVPNESDWSTQLLVVASEGVNRFYPKHPKTIVEQGNSVTVNSLK